ncbi:hypothetical protein QYF36_020078 [Acer negundo]|nr:hypothetical protein QYF36_020078 [Acer negundo]
MHKKRVEAIIGTLPVAEAALISMIDETTTNNISIISLTSPGILPPQQLPSILQMSNDITLHTRCIAAIVGIFKWRKVTAIYENNNDFAADYGLVTLLSDSLRIVNSEIKHHLSFPSLTSLSKPKAAIEEELKKLMTKSNRVLVLLHCSLELAILIFDKAKQMSMMEKGYVWIVSEEIANLLHSLDSSVFDNMQGVLGIRTNFIQSSKSFRHFKTKFRKKYQLKYPKEEEYSNPSIFALRAYDAVWTIAQAIEKKSSQAKIPSAKLLENILSSKFEGLSGKIGFKNGKLAENPTFQIINVVGTSYKEMTFWSPLFGFCETIICNKSVTELSPVYWPGGLRKVPKGWSSSNEEQPLKIGVPANGAFNQFVRVSYDLRRNGTYVSGFSVKVFEAVVNRLPYHLPYVLVPFYGSYDDMVEQIFYKGLDAAVGDIEIMANRYQYAEFSQPYVESGLVMIVPVKPDKSKETWLFMKTFTTKMWLLMVFPKGSPLLFDIAEAILKVTETGEINQLEEDMLSSFKCTSSLTDIIDSPSLGPRPFSGLLFVSGGVSGFAFLVAIVRLAERELQIVNCLKKTTLLKSSLLGFPCPVNSVGNLPLEYINMNEADKVEAVLANTKQILNQFLQKSQPSSPT